MAIEWAPICTDGSKNRDGQRHARSLGMRRYRQKQREEIDRRYERKCQAPATDDGRASFGEGALKTNAKAPTIKDATKTTPNAPTITNGRELGGNTTIFNSLAKPEPEDQIGSPEVMAESMLFCKRYVQWLKPELVLTDSDFAMFTAEQELPDSLLVAASHLVAARHLDAASFHWRGEHYEEHKNVILTCISQRLKRSGGVVSSDLMNIIACLLHFELCEGNDHEAMVHLQGLKILMDAPGILGQQRFTETTMNLEMAALINDLTSSQNSEAVSILPSNTYGEASYSPYHLIILTEELKRMGEPSLHSKLAKELPTMRNVSRFVEFSLDTRNDQHEVYTQASLGDFDIEFDRRPGYDPADDALIVKAMQASSSIVYRYAVQKYPIRDNVNQDLVKSIVNALLFTPNERWRSLRFYRLFMLLIGTSVAERETRSFCEAHLVRAIMQMGAEAWMNAREFIVKFIENMNSVRVHLRKTTPAGLIDGPPP